MLTWKDYLKEWKLCLLFLFTCWLSLSLLVLRFRQPKLTETELFLCIPHAVVLERCE